MRTSTVSLLIFVFWALSLAQGQMKDTPNDGRDNNDGSDGPKCEGEVQGGLLDGILGLDGSLEAGGSACPPKLASTGRSTSTSSGSAFSSVTQMVASSQTRVSPSGSSTATVPLATSSASKKGTSTAVVAGIALAVLFIGFIVGLILHRRRLWYTGARRPTGTISPFTLIAQSGRTGRDVRDIGVDKLPPRLFPTREEMEDLERRMPQEAPSDSARERILHLISTRSSTSTRRASDLEAQLHAAREQIDMLSTRMDGLEVTADYARVMGTSNESPPEYV
ncbi:hypothetical protein B0H13DRAFT_1870344 [Mycena leptocephala]|nr:hypothetical protein B0H13DRAFT_1870344 [Mycena leptocephala]